MESRAKRRALLNSVEYLSFGAGPPSVALMILNAWGEVKPRAEIVVFADTSWEKGKTYKLLPLYEAWAMEHELEFIKVQAKVGSLPDYIRNRSETIPLYTPGGPSPRQCTRQFKIQPIQSYLRKRFGKVHIIAQLAMTYDEIERLKDSPTKSVTNRWPLVEKKLKRDATVEIIKMAGLPVPPWSACVGCPLQSNGVWKRLASEFPQDFKAAVEMDEFVRARSRAKGKGDFGLHYSRRPLASLFSTDQLLLGLNVDGAQGLCESGHCFT